MAASVSSPYAGASPSKHTGLRVTVGLLGLATVVVGIVILVDLVAAARTLALLVGLALVLGGVLEAAAGWDSGRRWSSAVLGAVLVVGGVLAAIWPGVTLWTIALIIGLSLVAHGAARIIVAVTARHEIPGWRWLAVGGVVNVLLGVLAIAWPQATVLVLSLVLGVQITVFGLLLLLAAFWHPGARSEVPAGA
jgi:uncharacterized membrane protein HdeD (DUF308 family)